jgi:hypothetical protein
VRTVLTNSCIDIMAPGWDRDSGAGILMALKALQNTPAPAFKAATDPHACWRQRDFDVADQCDRFHFAIHRQLGWGSLEHRFARSRRG